jgi:hypothetical protein
MIKKMAIVLSRITAPRGDKVIFIRCSINVYLPDALK